ncbi:uncharacterized protein LOC116364976 isoform X2 [Oncorhynchus kisutch]|uniref:uncharacterized protein LOC116364976 isoform X2 n=1 Tax=Oncorhynchus kisutch TaxID=8019 RepID=UPI0012DE0D00|nr:uncharacterized protein LOC116364976 isoform X2 [Oncorhynchus kisutch]
MYSMAAMSTCLSLSPQSGRVTRLIERKYHDVISSSSSDDFSIYSFTDCESECDDEDHERRTPKLKVENGKETKLDVRDMDEDDDLSLHSFDESDFLSPGKVSGPVSVKNGLSPLVTSAHRTLAEALRALPSAVGSPYPVNVPRPRTPLNPVIIAPPRTENFPYRHSPRLAPITNLSETGRKLLQEMAGVTPQVSSVAAVQTEMFKEIMDNYYFYHTHTQILSIGYSYNTHKCNFRDRNYD